MNKPTVVLLKIEECHREWIAEPLALGIDQMHEDDRVLTHLASSDLRSPTEVEPGALRKGKIDAQRLDGETRDRRRPTASAGRQEKGGGGEERRRATDLEVFHTSIQELWDGG